MATGDQKDNGAGVLAPPLPGNHPPEQHDDGDELDPALQAELEAQRAAYAESEAAREEFELAGAEPQKVPAQPVTFRRRTTK